MSNGHGYPTPDGQESATGYWCPQIGTPAIGVMAVFAIAIIVVLMLSLDPKLGEYGPSQPFPEIRNWRSLTITLQRGLCFGGCPAYAVEVHGDGTVVYRGTECVAVKGERRSRIAITRVAQLVQAFRAANYFSLRDYYVQEIPDASARETSISFDKSRKAVRDYRGEGVGMPRSVNMLERKIDRVAGTDR